MARAGAPADPAGMRPSSAAVTALAGLLLALPAPALSATGGVAYSEAPVPPATPVVLPATLAGLVARAPAGAPRAVRRVIAAGNRLQVFPYRYGGGHAAFKDTAYDCSGSVSFALHGGRLLAAPLDSTGLARWGAAGPGRWITVYANPQHAFMVVAGLRLDTSGTRGTGPRWQPAPRSTDGFTARHPLGL